MSQTEANPLHFDGQALFLVEGTLSELQTAPTIVNLLAQIDSHIKAKSLVAGGAAALGGLHGMVANSAALALYDGEEVCHFAGLLPSAANSWSACVKLFLPGAELPLSPFKQVPKYLD